jgi:ferritin-like metal-binding protein YciE
MHTQWSGPVLTPWTGWPTAWSAFPSWPRVCASIGACPSSRHKIEVCLKRFGSDTSTFKDLAGRFVGIAQAFAVEVASDEVVKDCCAAYSWRHFEIACYLSLGAAATALEEAEVVRMCEEHIQQERAMAQWLEQQIPETTRAFLMP